MALRRECLCRWTLSLTHYHGVASSLHWLMLLDACLLCPRPCQEGLPLLDLAAGSFLQDEVIHTALYLLLINGALVVDQGGEFYTS